MTQEEKTKLAHERAIRIRGRKPRKEIVAKQIAKQQARASARMVMGNYELPVEIGSAYFFRTVTYHMVGRVELTCGSFVKLVDAAWVADTERFMQAIGEGRLREVEPVGEAWVNLDSVTDFFPWKHTLPLNQQ